MRQLAVPCGYKSMGYVTCNIRHGVGLGYVQGIYNACIGHTAACMGHTAVCMGHTQHQHRSPQACSAPCCMPCSMPTVVHGSYAHAPCMPGAVPHRLRTTSSCPWDACSPAVHAPCCLSIRASRARSLRQDPCMKGPQQSHVGRGHGWVQARHGYIS